MASLGVLAQLMQGMASSQMDIPRWNPVEEESQRELLQQRRTGTETALLTLFEQKQKQAAEQEFLNAVKNDPRVAQMLLGTIGSLPTTGGGQPAPTSLTQQTIMPGQPPGAPQTVPGGQDLSQFATQGGPLQSTIASLGPAGQPQMQAPQNPALEMARTNPRAAFLMQQQIQGQQDLALRRDEQRLTMGTKVAEYVGRVAQGVTSQETLEQARQELVRIHPQAAAQLPQTYSKEAMIPFVKRALAVKDSADLQLRTMHEQTEAAKLNIQLQQAGYQGLGTDVTSILRGLSEEQVKQFGGRTTAPAVAYATEQARKVAGMSDTIKTELGTMKVNPVDATADDLAQAQKNIQARELGKAGEAERLKFELEEKQRSTLPLQDARKEDSGLFVSKGTGQTIPGTMPYGQVKQLQDEKDPEKGVIKLANLDEKKQLTTLKQLEPVLQQYADLVQYAYGTDEKTGKKGPLADYTRSPSDVITAMYGQLEQTDPTFQAKRRALQGQLQSVVRGLGARGDLNEAELKAATEMIANMDASMGLGLGLGVGAGGGGLMFGAKPTISIPDSPATGVALANELIGTVNRRIGSILQHEGYAKTPTIKLQTGPPASTTTGTAPSTTPPAATTPAPTTPAPTPPAKPRGRQPGEIPVLGGPGMPEQYLPAPGKQSQAAPAPAPAPSAPATKPTPGRQAQASAGTRLAGGPKYMDLADVQEAMAQTGKDRKTIERRARELGYTVYGSRLPLPDETMVG